jgi:hypothetical protein
MTRRPLLLASPRFGLSPESSAPARAAHAMRHFCFRVKATLLLFAQSRGLTPGYQTWIVLLVSF